MRFLMLVLLGLFFVSCTEQVNVSREKEVEKILNNGNWRLIESDQSFERFQSGLKFSEDYQVFNIDSQGQMLASTHERLYSVIGDTLKLVDYKFEEKFLYPRGTDILIIEELTSDRMVLKAIHPEEPNTLIFENLK